MVLPATPLMPTETGKGACLPGQPTQQPELRPSPQNPELQAVPLGLCFPTELTTVRRLAAYSVPTSKTVHYTCTKQPWEMPARPSSPTPATSPGPTPHGAQCEDQLLIQLSNPSPTSSHCAAPSACKATVTVPLSRQLYPTSSLLNSRLLGVGAHLLGPDAPTSLRKGLLPPRAHILDPTCCCHSWLGAGHMTYCWP